MQLKFVHAADLHLDSPLRGLSRYEGAPVEQLRSATRRALVNLVDLCLEDEVDLLLLAGDLYDGDWRDYATGLFFAAQMSRLRAADIQVVWIRGNHDAQSRITRHLELPENVQELSTKKPQSLLLDTLGVAIHGQGFATAKVTEDLAASYPEPAADLFNIGLLHTALSGREGHAPYAPADVRTLQSKGYDYWALGHVHQREVVSESPWIVFPGNLQGRHIKETGHKGASLVRVEDGAVRDVTHRSLDVVRWSQCRVDLSDAVSGHDAVELCREALSLEVTDADGRPVAARLILEGGTAAHSELSRDAARWEAHLRAMATDLGVGDVWLERIRFATRAHLDRAGLEERDDAVGQLARTLRDLRKDPSGLGGLFEEITEIERRWPPELSREGGGSLSDPANLRELLGEVEELLLPRLLEDA